MAYFTDKYGTIYLINNSKEELTIGRSEECDITTPPINSAIKRQIRCAITSKQIIARGEYNSVSNQHAIFNTQTNKIRDNSSSNGTKVNGVRLEQGHAAVLKSGNSVELGILSLYYVEILLKLIV